jgi:glycosyltransferase involved in cell wall biosynthesis
VGIDYREPSWLRNMRILRIHNKYRFRGGEDVATDLEDALLLEKGQEISQIYFDSRDIAPRQALLVGLQTAWNQTSYNRVYAEISAWRPDVVDVQNYFPIASPAVHHAAHRLRVPVIQTLHNYRLLCPSGTFFRNGAICEDCVTHRVPWPGVVNRCYNQSAIHTSAVASMITVHRVLKTWEKAVTLILAVSEFQKAKFVEHGFPESGIVVKPNFVLDPGPPKPDGKDFIFVGRLVVEKGVMTLLKAMELVPPSVRLTIVGDGLLQPQVVEAARNNPRIRYVGVLSQAEVIKLVAQAGCLILPSEWYEPWGRVAAEAYSLGTPVIGSRMGAITEIVKDQRTGLHFTAGDAGDLARAIVWMCDHPDLVQAMRREARCEFEKKYSAEGSYPRLMNIYARAIAENQRRYAN